MRVSQFGFDSGLYFKFILTITEIKTLPKALWTQALTALNSNFGLVGLVGLIWWVCFGGFGLVGLVW